MFSFSNIYAHAVDVATTEAVSLRYSVKIAFLKISQNSHENTCVGVSFLIKLLNSGQQLYSKRDSNMGIFLWILQNS